MKGHGSFLMSTVREQWRTPRKNFRRGTQMPRKGEIRTRQNGGAQRDAWINFNLLPIDEIAKQLYKNSNNKQVQERQNGREEESEGETSLQDGDEGNRNRTYRPIRQRRSHPLHQCVAVRKVRTCNGHKIMMIQDSGSVDDSTHCVGKDKCDPCNADFVEKVDEWLKHRSDSLSSVEFDGEVKGAVDWAFSTIIGGKNETDCDKASKKDTDSDIAQMPIRISDVFTLQTGVGSNTTGGRFGFGGGRVDGCEDNVDFAVHNEKGSRHRAFSPEVIRSTNINTEEKRKAARLNKSALDLRLQESGAGSVNVASDCGAFSQCEHLYSSKKLNKSAEFCESDKNMMLMTPEELERMPESGIEFEESVGPKELEISVKNKEMDEEVNSKTTDVEAAATVGDSGTVVATTASASSTLATISISTDSRTNTTSIVINTRQGQQAFKINTTNVMQAAATLQPITLADLVDEKGATVLTDPRLAVPTMAGSKNQDKNNSIEVQDMPSVSPGRIPASGCLQDEKGTGGLICAHTGRCKKMWTCPEPSCGKVYTKQCKLKVHTMVHSGVRPYKCEVEGCDWSFTTVYKLKRHLETHCGAKDYTCDIDGCSRRFTTIYNLNSHKKLHAQSQSIACPIESCGEHFKTRRKMELHLREHRGVDAPYKCPVDSCGKMYYTANSMASHLRVHQKANFQCSFEGCSKVFDKMSRYKVHMWKHTGERPYVCTFEGCSWAFSSASKLKRHMRKHTGERQYTCTEPACGKSFMRLEHLQGHLVTHSGDKPFKCPHENCAARFTAKSSLYVHLKKHKGNAEKEIYPCPIENCDKKYNCKSSLRIHMLRYHTPVLTDAGQLDYITLLANGDELQSLTLENYSQLVAQQNAISIAAAAPSGITALNSDVGLVDSQEFVSPQVGEQCTITIPASNMLTQPVLVPAMVIGDIQNTTVADQSAQIADSIVLPPQPAIVETLSSCVLQENNSGSARTDFCSNHLLINRARKRNQLQAKKNPKCTIEADEQPLADHAATAVAVPQLTSSDVVLTSSAISFQNPATNGIQFIQSQLLSDDPPHGDLYQEDGLLTSMANELAVPISLLAEPPVTDPSGQGNDFSNANSAVTDFTGTTINLQDLE